MTALDLSLDAAALTVALCDIESVSGNEKPLADAIEQALRGLPHLSVDRDGDAVVARTSPGAPSGWSSPATSTPSRSATTCRAGSRTAASTAAARPT